MLRRAAEKFLTGIAYAGFFCVAVFAMVLGMLRLADENEEDTQG